MRIGLLFLVGFLMPVLWCSAEAVPKEDHVSKRYTYESLSTYQKKLLNDFIEDELPAGKKIPEMLTDSISIRNMTRMAQALMFRNAPGDTENALTIIRWVLKYQHQDVSSRNYGVWRTHVVGDRFDQNWREFVGCDLIIIYRFYKNRLPADLLADMEKGLTHAALGAMKRNVGADYTNISLMSAFLMDFVGNDFKRPELVAAGLRKANEIAALYNRHNTFSEYNSPTYYGVTLIAIALWRELGSSSELRDMGSAFEREFWKEIVTFYNPNLKNMPAPYFRGYGMDMQKYYAITGLWIAVAVNDKALAPLPFGQGPKFGEISNIAAIYHLGLEIPKASLAQLTRFSSQRYLERAVPNTYPGDTLKRVTSMIYKDWMMGGVWGNRKPWNQVKTGAMHWKNGANDVGWLLVPGDGNTNVIVSRSDMKVYLANKEAKQVHLFVYTKDITSTLLAGQMWMLPGMALKVGTTLKRVKTETVDTKVFREQQAVSDILPSVVGITFEVPVGWDTSRALLEIVPVKK